MISDRETANARLSGGQAVRVLLRSGGISPEHETAAEARLARLLVCQGPSSVTLLFRMAKGLTDITLASLAIRVAGTWADFPARTHGRPIS